MISECDKKVEMTEITESEIRNRLKKLGIESVATICQLMNFDLQRLFVK